jgi:hypothetical protein
MIVVCVADRLSTRSSSQLEADDNSERRDIRNVMACWLEEGSGTHIKVISRKQDDVPAAEKEQYCIEE